MTDFSRAMKSQSLPYKVSISHRLEVCGRSQRAAKHMAKESNKLNSDVMPDTHEEGCVVFDIQCSTYNSFCPSQESLLENT